MSDHPILFSGDMVKAILDGRKTQTRRVVKPQPPQDCERVLYDPAIGWRFHRHKNLHCPYGQPGDRLYVREKFRIGTERYGEDEYAQLIYCADDSPYEIDGSEIDMGRLKLGKTYPSIHMPKWAARIWLEITGVRVERVCEITVPDVEAEGLDLKEWAAEGYGAPATGFAALWNKLNAKRGYSWESNPFCWCISFKRIDTPACRSCNEGRGHDMPELEETT